MKPQTIYVPIIVVVAVAAAILINRRSTAEPPHGPPRLPDPDFQVDVLAQEEATPGKIIRISGASGAEALKYTCTADDAAIAVFTIRDKESGEAIPAMIKSAKDTNQRDYSASISVGGPICVLSLKREFAVKPKVVNVNVGNGHVLGSKEVTIPLSKIADPVRLFVPPRGAKAAAAEKIARATFVRDRKYIDVKVVRPLPPDMVEYVDLLDTSFGPAIMGFGILADCPDAVRVRLRRYRRIPIEYELIYKNAKVLHLNGTNFLSLPTKQLMGEMEGLGVMGGNRAPAEKGKSARKNLPSNQQLDLAWSVIPFPKTHATLQDPNGGYSMGQVAAISPSIEDMGLDSLRLNLASGNIDNRYRAGLSAMIKATKKSELPKKAEIQELRIKVLMTHQEKVSTQEIILPVHQ